MKVIKIITMLLFLIVTATGQANYFQSLINITDVDSVYHLVDNVKLMPPEYRFRKDTTITRHKFKLTSQLHDNTCSIIQEKITEGKYFWIEKAYFLMALKLTENGRIVWTRQHKDDHVMDRLLCYAGLDVYYIQSVLDPKLEVMFNTRPKCKGIR